MIRAKSTQAQGMGSVERGFEEICLRSVGREQISFHVVFEDV